MEEFVQSSGDDGIVIFSLGSLVKKMPKETSNMIASALAQIQQKVTWHVYIQGWCQSSEGVEYFSDRPIYHLPDI